MKTTGLNHIILTTSNVAKSRAFYEGLLHFEVHGFENGFYFISGGVEFFFFPSRDPVANDRFSEFRIGLDHLGFAAPNEEELHNLAERLTRAGVETQGVETFHTGNQYVAFRDPDNIQLEYGYLRNGSNDEHGSWDPTEKNSSASLDCIRTQVGLFKWGDKTKLKPIAKPKPTRWPCANAACGLSRCSGEAKELHRLRRFRLRRLLKVNIEGVMVAAGQNLKRLIKRRLGIRFCLLPKPALERVFSG